MRALLFGLLAFTLAACIGSSPDDGDVRFIHASAGTDSLDVLIGGRVVFGGVAFAEVTGYETLQAEERDVLMRSSQDRSIEVLRFVANLIPERPQTLIAAGVRPQTLPIALLDSLFTGTTSAQVRLVHAAALADTFVLTLTAVGPGPTPQPLDVRLGFRQNSGYRATLPGSYRLDVRPLGASTAALSETLTLAGGVGRTLVITDAHATGGLALIDATDVPPAPVAKR